MARDVRGILMQDPRIHSGSIDTTLTTADQADPLGMLATPLRPSDLALAASGEVLVDDVTIETVRSGSTGTQPSAGAYTYDRDGTDYGWTPPSSVTEVGWVNFYSDVPGSISSLLQDYSWATTVLPSGRVLCVTWTGATGYTIRVRRHDPSSTSTTRWTQIAAVDEAFFDALDNNPKVAVVQIGDRTHLYLAYNTGVPAASGGSALQIACWTSDDEGATWALATQWGLDDDRGVTGVDSFSAAVSHGEVLAAIVVQDTLPAAAVWVVGSRDGIRWHVPSTYVLVDADASHAVVVPRTGGGWLVYYQITSAESLYCRRYGSSYQESEVGTDITVDGLVDSSLYDQTCWTVWVGEDGAYYCLWLGLQTTQPTWYVLRSEDGIRYVLLGPWYRGLRDLSLATGFPSGIRRVHRPCCVETRGVSILVAHPQSDDDELDGATICWWSGGHSTLAMPPSRAAEQDAAVLSWSQTYHAIALIGEVDDYEVWGTAVVPTATVTLQGGGLQLEAASGETVTYTLDTGEIGGSGTQELLVELQGRDVTGSITTLRSGVELRYVNAGTAHMLEVRMDATQLNVRSDGLSIVTLSWDLDEPWVLRVAMYRGRAAVWIRALGAPEEHTWTLVWSGTGLSSEATAETHHGYVWGIHGTAAVAASITVARASVAHLPAGYLTDTGAEDLPLVPRAYSPQRTTIPGGVALVALGTTITGDSWLLSGGRYRHGFAALDLPSPRRTWRSTTDGSAMDIAWDLTGWADDSQLLTGTLAAALIKSNVRSYSLVGRTAAGVETVLAIGEAQPLVDDVVAYAFAYRRDGAVIRAAVDAEPWSRWLSTDELVGYTLLDVTTGAGLRILRSSSGTIGGVGTHQACAILLHPDDDPESLGTSGTCRLVAPTSLLYRHNAANTPYRWLILRIAAQVTREGYYEIGGLVLGPLHVLGRSPAWAQGQGRESGSELITLPDGTRTSVRRAPQRRYREVAWTDLVDETQLEDGAPVLLTTPGAGTPVAAAADTVRLLEGLWSQLDGHAGLAVYVAHLDLDDESALTERAGDLLYGRIVSSFEREQVLGVEGRTELVRGGQMRIEEEL